LITNKVSCTGLPRTFFFPYKKDSELFPLFSRIGRALPSEGMGCSFQAFLLFQTTETCLTGPYPKPPTLGFSGFVNASCCWHDEASSRDLHAEHFSFRLFLSLTAPLFSPHSSIWEWRLSLSLSWNGPKFSTHFCRSPSFLTSSVTETFSSCTRVQHPRNILFLFSDEIPPIRPPPYERYIPKKTPPPPFNSLIFPSIFSQSKPRQRLGLIGPRGWTPLHLMDSGWLAE